MSAENIGYFAKQVCLDMEIHASTLRRWCAALERKGYKFDKNENNQRIFYERDYKALREIKKSLASGISFVDAINLTVSMHSTNNMVEKAPGDQKGEMRLQERDYEIIANLLQEAIQRTATKEREAFEKLLENKLAERDKLFFEELQKHQSLLEEQRENDKTSPWWKWFAKKR